MKNCIRISSVFLLCVGSHLAKSQANVRGYIDDELFKVKPVVSTSNFQEERNGFDFLENDLEKGISLFSSGNLDDALYYFKELALEYKDVPTIPFYQGLILFQKENYQEARGAFVSALRINPLFLTSYYYLGLIELEEGNLKLAKENMDRLTSIEEYASLGYFGQAQIATYELNPYKTVRMYQKCIETDTMFQEAYIPLATIELSFSPDGRVSKRLMDKAVRRFPDWEEGIITRAILSVFLDQDNLNQFEADINKLISLSPDNYHYYSLKGYLDIELHQYSSAVENFKKALDLDFKDSDKGEYKFNTKFKHNIQLKEAIDYYYKHKYLFNTSVENSIDRGICHLVSDSKKSALPHFDSAMLIQPHSAVSLLKAVTYDLIYEEKEALEFYTQAILQDSLNASAYLRRGDLYAEAKEYDRALVDYTKLIKLKSRSKEGYKKRGAVYMQLNKYHKSYLDITHAIMLDSTDSDLFFNRAYSATKMRHFGEAIKDINHVLEKRPHDSEAYYLLSLNHFYLQDTLHAISFLDSASLYGKYMKNYHLELIDLGLKRKMYDIVVEGYGRLIKYFSYEKIHLYNRGLLFYELGKYDLAARDFEELLKHKKNDAGTNYYYGKSLIVLGEEKEGTRFIEKSLKLGFIESK